MTENPRWTRRPDGSTWGDWGPDDQLGRLNLLTPERVLTAREEIRLGEVYCLSLPLDYPGRNILNPRRHPPVLEPTRGPDGAPRYNFPLQLEDPHHIDVGCDDRVQMTLQYSSQWDAFCHMGQMFDADGDGIPEIRFYNGFRGGEDIIGPVDYNADGSQTPRPETMGARRLGIETFAEKGVVGRGVMIDLERFFGREGRHLVTCEDLMRVLEETGATVEEGDLAFFYTGFADLLLEMEKEPDGPRLANSCAALDGRDDRLLQWITDSGVAALFADNYAVEQSPARPAPGERYAHSPLHQHCLFKLGVPLGELWYLGGLARRLRELGRTRFFTTCQPLRLPGAVGSPANPVGIV